MPFNKYFQDELDYLKELGGEFVKENPKLEPFLSPSDPDPDVKRLMEGFAFLTGRLRQKLDDEFPELTHSLMRVLWPHYLRPVPCMSILELKPITGALTGPQRLARGQRLEARPLGDPPVKCRFRTCYDIELLPISLAAVEYRNAGSGGVLELVVEPLAGVSLERLGLQRLRLYLHAERDSAVGSVLYLWMRRYLAEIELAATLADGKTQTRTYCGEREITEVLRPVGFDEADALLPYPENAFGGYRLLQEYFSLPEKFHFLELGGLGFVGELPRTERLTLRFRFSRPLDDHLRVRPEAVRLHCTPIVNLFEHDADPIRLDYRQSEYRVRPHSDQPRFFEVYSVERVRGSLQGSGRSRAFAELESFAHASAGAPSGAEDDEAQSAGFYRLRLVPSVVGRGVETYISFVNEGGLAAVPAVEIVSLELACSNRNLPEQLRVGEIDQACDGSPELATFRNIAKVSPSLAPPLDARLHWRLISNMALNHYSLSNVNALREILATYDFRAMLDEQARRESEARLMGIESIRDEPAMCLKGGLPVRGRRIAMTLRERSFGGQGPGGEAGMFLFATVLDEFFALYASVNSFHELRVTGSERKEEYRWPRRDGLLPLL